MKKCNECGKRFSFVCPRCGAKNDEIVSNKEIIDEIEKKTSKLPNKELKRILFVPDTHVPYHDRKKFQLLLKAGHQFKPDVVVVLGDFADFYAVSDHSKDPHRVNVLEDELAEVKVALKALINLGADKNIYISGNHEDRYDRYINNHAPALSGLLSLRDALGVAEDGWTWVPYKQSYKLGKLHLTHDAGKAGKYAHYDAQQAFEGNVIIGHTHRLGFTVVGNAEGKPHLGCMFGWLGDVEQVDYMHRVRMMRDWAHGFGVGYMQADGCVHVVPLPIVNNSVVLEGELICV